MHVQGEIMSSSCLAQKMLRIGQIISETSLICSLIENKRKDDFIMATFANEIRTDCNILLNKALQLAIKKTAHDKEDEKALEEILEKVTRLESQCNHCVKVIHKNGHSLFV